MIYQNKNRLTEKKEIEIHGFRIICIYFVDFPFYKKNIVSVNTFHIKILTSNFYL